MVVEGVTEVETDDDATVRVEAGGCYFVEAEDTHKETAIEASVVLVTQGEDHPYFLRR